MKYESKMSNSLLSKHLKLNGTKQMLKRQHLSHSTVADNCNSGNFSIVVTALYTGKGFPCAYVDGSPLIVHERPRKLQTLNTCDGATDDFRNCKRLHIHSAMVMVTFISIVYGGHLSI